MGFGLTQYIYGYKIGWYRFNLGVQIRLLLLSFHFHKMLEQHWFAHTTKQYSAFAGVIHECCLVAKHISHNTITVTCLSWEKNRSSNPVGLNVSGCSTVNQDAEPNCWRAAHSVGVGGGIAEKVMGECLMLVGRIGRVWSQGLVKALVLELASN